jgi:putative spermidine/putrescine transport system ATP-binding protein/spermidine/putrescine transport system ATP-binding protein
MCTLMVRPEKITLGTAGHPHAGLDGAVEEVIYVGEFTRYRVRVTPAVVINVKVANTHAASRAKHGDNVRLWWAAADASYLVAGD